MKPTILNKLLLFVVALLVGLTLARAQTIDPNVPTYLAWEGSVNNPIDKSIPLLDSDSSLTVTVRAFTSSIPGARQLAVQPTFTRANDTLYVHYPALSVITTGYMIIKVGTLNRFMGPITIDRRTRVSRVPVAVNYIIRDGRPGKDADTAQVAALQSDVAALDSGKVAIDTYAAYVGYQGNVTSQLSTSINAAATTAQNALTGVTANSTAIVSTSVVATSALTIANSATTAATQALTGVAANTSAIAARLNYVTSSGLFSTATADVVQFDNASWERKSGTVTTSTPGYGGILFPGPTGFYYERKFYGPVDPRMFGAVSGDGIDDAAAIQALINTVPNNTSVRGGEITIPAGFWDIATTLTLPVNVRLTIRGAATSMYNESGGSGSVLRWTGASGGVLMQYDGGTSGSAAQTRHNGPTIDGINFYSSDLTSTLLKFKYVTHWTVRNCSFRNGGTAFELDAGIGIVTGGDNAWGLWEQNIVLDAANYGVKVTNGTYGFTMIGGDMQPAMTGVGVYLDEYTQHVRMLGTKHDRGNPAIQIKGGHNHLVGISIENATVGIRIDRIASTYSGGTSVFSGKFNQVTASSIVGWAGSETGMILGSGTAANSIQFEGVNLASRLTDSGADSYSLFTNGIWRLQNKLSSVAVQEYNIGTTLAGQMFASGNGLIIGGTSGGINVILKPATGGGLQVQNPSGTLITNFNADGTATHRGTLKMQYATGATDPTAADIPAGYELTWLNTTTGTLKRWANVAGTLKSSAAFN